MEKMSIKVNLQPHHFSESYASAHEVIFSPHKSGGAIFISITLDQTARLTVSNGKKGVQGTNENIRNRNRFTSYQLDLYPLKRSIVTYRLDKFSLISFCFNSSHLPCDNA